MTIAQYRSWKAREDKVFQALINELQVLQCAVCYSNLESSIAAADEIGWKFVVRDNHLVNCWCPRCFVSSIKQAN